MVTARNLAQTLVDLTREGHSEEQVMTKFMKFVGDHHLEAALPAVVHYLEIFKKEQDAKLTCKIEVASEKEMDNVSGIAEKMGVPEGSTIEATINPELIAGFKSTFKGIMHDASLSSQLEKLQKHIAIN